MRLVNGLRFIPALVWMTVIYWLSDKPAPESSMESEGLAMRIVKLITENSGLSEADQMERALYLEPYIRDVAHVLEYAILAVFIYIAVKVFVSDFRKAVIWTVVICFLYSCTDEWHQYHVPGRAAQVVDIVLDTSGAVIALLVLAAKQILKKRRAAEGGIDEDNRQKEIA